LIRSMNSQIAYQRITNTSFSLGMDGRVGGDCLAGNGSLVGGRHTVQDGMLWVQTFHLYPTEEDDRTMIYIQMLFSAF